MLISVAKVMRGCVGLGSWWTMAWKQYRCHACDGVQGRILAGLIVHESLLL